MFTLYLEGLNALLLLGLGSIYWQNYRALPTLVGAGLLVFSLILLLQNGAGIFLHFTGGELYGAMAATHVFVLKLIETLALAFLAYSAWKE